MKKLSITIFRSNEGEYIVPTGSKTGWHRTTDSMDARLTAMSFYGASVKIDWVAQNEDGTYHDAPLIVGIH